ncbi:unnamed protein product [Durusdinium trenchii]|uniref:Rhodanese domain-containing protein n=1 Tax=Durusdinium trenchii TaxID=1381693 RepID=A0ABP0J2X6_9DINO
MLRPPGPLTWHLARTATPAAWEVPSVGSASRASSRTAVGQHVSRVSAALRSLLASGLALLLRSPLRRRKLEIQYSRPSCAPSASYAYSVLAFYLVHPVKAPQEEALQHKAWCRSRGLLGRVWVSSRGLNVQISGKTEDCERYADFVARRFRTCRGPLVCKIDPVPEPAFPRLRVKAKQLVSLHPELAEQVDMTDRGEDLEPEEWRRKLQGLSMGEPGKVLDVRNDYEWDLGHFAHAERPSTEQLRAMTAESMGLQSEDQETPLYMYCTGGIRCEFMGAALRQRGFKKVYKLKGGIQHYGNTVGAEEWKGRLFVFDRRNSISVGPEGRAEPQWCSTCGSRVAEEFWNCGNMDCNRCMVTCRECLRSLDGVCCKGCMRAARRLPATWRGMNGGLNNMQAHFAYGMIYSQPYIAK